MWIVKRMRHRLTDRPTDQRTRPVKEVLCRTQKHGKPRFEDNKAGYTGQNDAPALLIFRLIPGSIRPDSRSIDPTIDEYDCQMTVAEAQ